MQTFNLKKEWFNKIKKGLKVHEYREVKYYWVKRITSIHVNDSICFALGYPKKTENNKFLYAKVLSIKVINGSNTDLGINKNVFDIEFELDE